MGKHPFLKSLVTSSLCVWLPRLCHHFMCLPAMGLATLFDGSGCYCMIITSAVQFSPQQNSFVGEYIFYWVMQNGRPCLIASNISGGSRISHRGGRGPHRRGRGPPRQLRFKNFACQNERIWTRRGGHAPGAPPPLDPPMNMTAPCWRKVI